MSEHPGDFLYREGMKYDLKQDKSPSSAAVARAAFQQAAALGHREAIRALAHLVFDGTGGPRDREQGLLLLWSCFQNGEHEALEELTDMLHSFAEQSPQTANAKTAAQKLEQLGPLFNYVQGFLQEIARQRLIRNAAQPGAQADGPASGWPAA